MPVPEDGVDRPECDFGFARQPILASPETNKHDADKVDLSLLPFAALTDVARVLEFGANEYGRENWALGCDWSRYFSACMRHLWAWWRGETRDPKSGLHHLAHATCSLLFLLEYSYSGRGTDNRPKLASLPSYSKDG